MANRFSPGETLAGKLPSLDFTGDRETIKKGLELVLELFINGIGIRGNSYKVSRSPTLTSNMKGQIICRIKKIRK